MPEKFLADPLLTELAKRHPCLGREANATAGRLHLPVSPMCNIQCRFCRRSLNKTEQRPGVTGVVLTPQQALARVEEALKLCPEITVAGIAGPGDALASDTALETFRLVHEHYPQLLLCLSTNGLMLPEKARDFIDAGVRTITVTVNAVDPQIEAKIISHIVLEGVLYTGEEAASRLIERQLDGIRLAHSLGALLKINSVLIPGLNDSHIEEVARTVKEAGANIYNIIPLIPQHEFSDYPAPTCRQIEEAREAAQKYLPVFRHCQHCRADACGIPGKNEFSSRFSTAAAETFSHG